MERCPFHHLVDRIGEGLNAERGQVDTRRKKLMNDGEGAEVVKLIDYRTVRTVASLSLQEMNWLIDTIHSNQNGLEGDRSYRAEEGSA